MHPAGRHHLDDVTPPFVPLTHGVGEATRLDLPTEEPAVATLAGHGWAGGEDPGQAPLAAQVERDVAAVTEVPQRRDPRLQRHTGMPPCPVPQFVVGPIGHLLLQRADAVEHEVLVRVDQPRQECHVSEIDDLAAAGLVADSGDATLVERHGRRRQEPLTVEDATSEKGRGHRASVSDQRTLAHRPDRRTRRATLVRRREPQPPGWRATRSQRSGTVTSVGSKCGRLGEIPSDGLGPDREASLLRGTPMTDDHFRVDIPKSWVRRAVIALAVSMLLLPASAWASNVFQDVPGSNAFHNDIGWLAAEGVTRGCNPPANDEYCPDDNVTREQMAAFLHRLDTEDVFVTPDEADLNSHFAVIDGQTGAVLAGDDLDLATRESAGVFTLDVAAPISACSWTGALGARDGVIQTSHTLTLNEAPEEDAILVRIVDPNDDTPADHDFNVTVTCDR